MHGKGVYLWPYGDKYTGDFKDDYIQGEGILTMQMELLKKEDPKRINMLVSNE